MTLISDSFPEEDILKRRGFAKEIAKSITASAIFKNESFVIGIIGEWGSGKSTLMTYIEEYLAKGENNAAGNRLMVRFNSWESFDMQDIQRNVVERILRKLEKHTWKTNVKFANETLKRYLKYTRYLKFLKHVHPVAKSVVGAVEEYEKKVAVESLEELKAQVSRLLVENNSILYVFIDDLDRLEPPEIAEVFKTIKLSANFQNTIFIVAYDKAAVVKSLDMQFPNMGNQYLEKIIQVDFIVPKILGEQIEEIFFSNLDECLNNIGIKSDKQEIFLLWRHRGLKEYFNTLRDVKRFFNSLYLSFPNIKEEVNVADFIALESIKVFDYENYDKLYNVFRELRRKAEWMNDTLSEAIENSFGGQTTSTLLRYLFLEGKKTTFNKDSLSSKRLRDPAYFERYYSMFLNSSDVTEITFQTYLTKGSNKQHILADALEGGRINNLIRRLADRESYENLDLSDIKNFTELMKFWNGKEMDITLELQEALWSAYFHLVGSSPNKYEAAREAVRDLIMDPNDIQALRLLFNHNILAILEGGHNDPLISGEIEKILKAEHRFLKDEFIKNLQSTGPAFIYKVATRHGSFVCDIAIFNYAKLLPNLYLNLLQQYIDRPDFLYFMVRNVFSRGELKPERIDMRYKEIYFPGAFWDSFIKHLKNLKDGVLEDTQFEYIKAFLDLYEE